MGARHGSTTRVSSTLRCAAIAAALALLPASAVAQVTVHLECQVRPRQAPESQRPTIIVFAFL
jgi:hypothetical protein